MTITKKPKKPARSHTSTSGKAERRPPKKQWTAGRPQFKPDTEWFKDKLVSMEISAARLAPRLKMHPSAFHHLIYGRRRATAAEVEALADVFDTTRNDMLKKLGASDTEFHTSVAVVGIIGPHGQVEMTKSGIRKLDRVEGPFGVSGRSTRALRVDAPGPAAHWVMFVDLNSDLRSLIGRLALVAFMDGGEEKTVVGTVTRGFQPRTYTVLEWDDRSGSKAAEDITIKSAALVTWIKTT